MPIKGDIVLTSKGHRRLWDGRHWRVLCRISYCKAQRQGSLCSKFGLCKKHFTQMKFIKLESVKSSSLNVEQAKQNEKINKCKRHNLNIIVDKLRRSQTISVEQ